MFSNHVPIEWGCNEQRYSFDVINSIQNMR